MTRRILCLFLEFDWWETARPLTYPVQLGLEEGLRTNRCRPLTVTTTWLPRLKEICGSRSFDQVWVEVVHQAALDDDTLDLLARLAPVRVGFLPESIHYDAATYAASPHYRGREGTVRHRLKFLTHAVAADELDAGEIDAAGDVRACWWPQAVPRRFVADRPATAVAGPAVFRGSLYGDRAAMARDARLDGVLVVPPPLERGTAVARMFDRLQISAKGWAARRPRARVGAAVHVFLLRRLRRRVFRRWMRALGADAIVVNLPHSVGAYPGRVVEAMAAGRPVVAWDVPGRPRNRALFEDGAEILLFSGREPAALADTLHRLRRDPARAASIATNGWRKVRRVHTIERRVEQILAWTDTGDAPVFS